MTNDTNRYRLLIVPVLINSVIFLLLSVLHFYWTFGGTFLYEDVLPTNSRGTNKLEPGTAASLVVSLGLLVFAFITAGNAGLFGKYVNRKYFRYGALVIAIILLLRAIGDFKFVGFFKTVDQTPFALNDTMFFSPLCVFIAVLSFLIFMMNRNNLRRCLYL